MFDNEKSFAVDSESDKNENISNSEDVTNSIDSPQNTGKSTSIQNNNCYNKNQKHSKVKNFVEYKILGSKDFQKAQIIKKSRQSIRQIFRLV